MNLIGSHKNVEYNAVYTNYASEIQHSYRVSEANKVDNAMYASRIKNSNMIVDSLCIGNSEYVYECTDSYHLYDCYYCRKSF